MPQLLAEAWLKATHPRDAFMREVGSEWRHRPMTEHQMVFCQRHGIDYDPTWSRGMANLKVDKFMVQVRVYDGLHGCDAVAMAGKVQGDKVLVTRALQLHKHTKHTQLEHPTA